MCVGFARFETDVPMITKSLVTFHLNLKVNIPQKHIMTMKSAVMTNKTGQNYTADSPDKPKVASRC